MQGLRLYSTILLNLPSWKQEELLFLEGGPGRTQMKERKIRSVGTANSILTCLGMPPD